MNFSWLLRRPGEILVTPLNRGRIYIKEVDETFTVDNEGYAVVPLKTGTYHVKLVELGDTNLDELFNFWADMPACEKEAVKNTFLKKASYHEFVINNEKVYYSNGNRRTSVKVEEIPEGYVNVRVWGMPGSYINARAIKEVIFKKCRIVQESIKDDALYISFDKEIVKPEGDWMYTGYDVIASGWDIGDVLEAMEKYSPDAKGLAKAKAEYAEAVEEREAYRKTRGW